MTSKNIMIATAVLTFAGVIIAAFQLLSDPSGGTVRQNVSAEKGSAINDVQGNVTINNN